VFIVHLLGVNGADVINGWLQYAHPERADRDADGNVDVPWVNGAYDPPYLIGNTNGESWEVPQTILQGSAPNRIRNLYLLSLRSSPASSAEVKKSGCRGKRVHVQRGFGELLRATRSEHGCGQRVELLTQACALHRQVGRGHARVGVGREAPA
jgi:hypothetical protein